MNHDDEDILDIIGSFRNVKEMAMFMKLFRLNQSLITTKGSVARLCNIASESDNNRYLMTVVFGSKIINYQELLFETVKKYPVSMCD